MKSTLWPAPANPRQNRRSAPSAPLSVVSESAGINRLGIENLWGQFPQRNKMNGVRVHGLTGYSIACEFESKDPTDFGCLAP